MAQAEYDRLKQLTQSSLGEQAHLKTSLQQLQERLRAGETTGDRIRDHVVAWHGLNEPLEQRLHQLEDDLTNHPGELVLVVSQHWETQFSNWHIKEKLYLGLATAPFFELHPGYVLDFSIVTPKHVAIDNYPRVGTFRGRDLIAVRDGSIKNFETSLMFIDKPLLQKRSDSPEESAAFQVVVGDEHVTQWFLDRSKRNMSEQYWQLEIGRSISVRERTEQSEMVRDVGLLLLYQRAQNVLGRSIHISPFVQEYVDDEILRRKTHVLTNLDELVQEDRLLTAQLAQMKGIRLPRISFPLDDPSYERQVREDEEDLRIIRLIPVTEERRRVQALIKAEIEKAFEMGMHKDPWVIVEEQALGKKVETNVPQLIRGYCEYYEIPIPQD